MEHLNPPTCRRMCHTPSARAYNIARRSPCGPRLVSVPGRLGSSCEYLPTRTVSQQGRPDPAFSSRSEMSLDPFEATAFVVVRSGRFDRDGAFNEVRRLGRSGTMRAVFADTDWSVRCSFPRTPVVRRGFRRRSVREDRPPGFGTRSRLAIGSARRSRIIVPRVRSHLRPGAAEPVSVTDDPQTAACTPGDCAAIAGAAGLLDLLQVRRPATRVAPKARAVAPEGAADGHAFDSLR